MMRNQFQILGVSLLGLVLFKGCDKAPKYVKPSVATPAVYKEISPDAFKETKDWKFARPNDSEIRGKWWEMYNDPQQHTRRSTEHGQSKHRTRGCKLPRVRC